MSGSIQIRNLSKRYNRSEQQTMIREALIAMVARLTSRRPEPRGDWIWALKDVSLDVSPGEVVGLVGRNGAGKSTLLKLLSRITAPTSGSLRVDGRVASLLEVGTGFHDELTGRENVYMNGSILGMKKKEIDGLMDAIVDFAAVGGFLDMPIKRYSSGMRMRLGFAVAAHLKSDILFVDEVLAVGDAAFQKKCLGSMRELSHCGRTVLFVSHNMAAVENLCPRAVWINGGQVEMDGASRDVIRAYLSTTTNQEETGFDLSAIRTRRGTGAVRLKRLEFLSHGGAESKQVVASGDSLTVRLHYEAMRDMPNLFFGLRVFSNLGTLITEASTWSNALEIPMTPRGEGYIDLEIDALNLMPSTYYLGLWVSSFAEWHDVLDHCAMLSVEPSDYYGSGRGIESRFGLMFLPCRWKLPACEEAVTQTG